MGTFRYDDVKLYLDDYYKTEFKQWSLGCVEIPWLKVTNMHGISSVIIFNCCVDENTKKEASLREVLLELCRMGQFMRCEMDVEFGKDGTIHPVFMFWGR